MNKKKVLFLYMHEPEPLPIQMISLLKNTNKYQVSLLYYQRINTPVGIPFSELLDSDQCISVPLPVINHFFKKFLNRCLAFIMLTITIKVLRPDVIHAWNFEMALAARLATIRLKNTKIVFSLQDTTEWMQPPLVKAIQRWVYRGVEQIFVTSLGFETQFLRRFRLIEDEQAVAYVPNVPPSAQFAHFEPRISGPELTVGYIGTFRGEKGIRTLVEAAALARDNGANVRVLFAGKGIAGEIIERFAEESKFVDYLGPYHHEQISNIYNQVDIIYALYDQSYDKKIHLAYRLCEAVNCRLPIIVAKGSHMADIVERHNIGVVVDIGDVKGLARELKCLHQSQEKRNRISQNCEKILSQFVFEHYQWEIYRTYEELWGTTTL
jgi:glycosyltransferase involved in cell wall biosynthesis